MDVIVAIWEGLLDAAKDRPLWQWLLALLWPILGLAAIWWLAS
jgi:hypothetical protein